MGEIEEKKPVLDVLVISHNKIEMIAGCLNTLYKNTAQPFHLIVVDDSTDLTAIWLNQFCKEHDNVTLIHSDTPYKNGNIIFEKGFEHCKTPFMATVMNSIKVEPEWELAALQLINSDPKIGCVACKCLFPNGLIESAGIKMVKYLPCDVGRDLPGYRCSLYYELEACQWAFAVVRVEAAKGTLDIEGFHGFRGWDDIDNCFVLKKNGWKIMFSGPSVGFHEPRATRGDNSDLANKENKENGIYFYKKWGFYDTFLEDNPDGQAVHATPKGMGLTEGKWK
jgi:GT2 family glycosyltransferase